MFQRAQHNQPNRIQWLASKEVLIARLLVNDEDLKTHIVEGELRQQHPRTHSSSPVFFDEGSLTA